MRWKWIVYLAFGAVAVAGIVCLSLTVADQTRQIDAMSREIDGLRRDAEFWPALVRAEFLRLEVRLRKLMEEWHGDCKRETRR